MHPLLPYATAAEYAHRAAVGLERYDHQPGVSMETIFDEQTGEASLYWTTVDPEDAEQLDRHRVTEDAAEAIALGYVKVARDWVVRRRLQRGESADWLLHDPEAGLVALEVSGVGTKEDPRRLQEKVEQARRATITRHRAACVVELPVPRTSLATA